MMSDEHDDSTTWYSKSKLDCLIIQFENVNVKYLLLGISKSQEQLIRNTICGLYPHGLLDYESYVKSKNHNNKCFRGGTKNQTLKSGFKIFSFFVDCIISENLLYSKSSRSKNDFSFFHQI